MNDLLNDFLSAVNPGEINLCECELAFVIDGLENCQLPLHFKKNKKVTDVSLPESMDVLLTNLIEGNLLPTAHLWIISQPQGVPKIPKNLINKVLESQDHDKTRLISEVKKSILVKFKNELEKEMDSELYEISENKAQTYSNVFIKSKKQDVVTVLTKGVAGIGKTFQTRRLMIDWANGKSNQAIDFIIPLSLRELKKQGSKEQSLEDLLNPFLYDANQERKNVCMSDCKLAIILDDFEEFKTPLDFTNNMDEITDVKKQALLDVLLTNLIKRTLLPTAHLWIICQPAGADQIPPEYIDKVTECRETLKRLEKLVSNLTKRFVKEYNQDEDLTHQNQRNVEHILIEHHAEETSQDGQPVGKIEAKGVKRVNVFHIFDSKKDEKLRTVLTEGDASVGKTFHVQKFVKEWAKNQQTVWSQVVNFVKHVFKTKDEVEVIFPIHLSRYDFTTDTTSTFMGLLNDLFEETKTSVISDYSKFRLKFILDGLDALQLPLDFDNPKNRVTDVNKPAALSVLLTNLIRGDLLPTAQVWITSQPSAAKKLPDNCINKKTKIRERPDITSKKGLKAQLRGELTAVSQETDGGPTSALLNEIYTNLYITEGEGGDIITEQIMVGRSAKEHNSIKYCDIFKTSSCAAVKSPTIKSVLTVGVAGIGKTFASMKYLLDWANAPNDEGVDYVFPLPFRELNLMKGQMHSLEQIIHQFFPAMEMSEITNYDQYNILVVLDGFDECRLDLNFEEGVCCTDVTEPTSVDVLVTNLIQGNLLPNAKIWITSRPVACNKIPSEKICRVTQVQGFNNKQKEEYFMKRFRNKELAEKIFSNVKKSRSLFIMCYIPVFCWITSSIIERHRGAMIPSTLTNLYTHFLLRQCKQANVKYNIKKTSERSEEDSCWNERNTKTVLSLGKLAFEELKNGNLVFTKDQLSERDIDITNAAIFSGLLTQIKREGRGLCQQELFSFVHMSIQEFLAAFHVTSKFTNDGENVFTEATLESELSPSNFYKKAVDKALESKNGDWNMFLRFLLGLSLEMNQDLLQGVLKNTESKESNKKTYQETIEHIKRKIREDVCNAEENINLFLCLNELNDNTVVEEVRRSLQSKRIESHSRSQFSALTFVLLTSDTNLDVFDLKMYQKSETVLLGMMAVVKVSKTALLSWCDLTKESCSGLATSVLRSTSSNVTVLDLSHNDLLDAGVELLADGLKSVHCKLKTLKVAGCQVSEKGCSALASALRATGASKLTELDLSYNHPGGRGLTELKEMFAHPNMKLCLDYAGPHRLKPGLKKYDALLKFDVKTASRRLVLLNGNRKVKTGTSVNENISHSEHKDRFNRSQVLCEEGLKGLGYWEVEWEGTVGIAVAYRDVGRTWDADGGLGCNDKSWSLLCSSTGYFKERDGKKFTGFIAMHGKMRKQIHVPCCQKLAVFLDWEAGALSYYSVSSGKLSLIHTFEEKFEYAVYPGFWFKNGSATLCDIVSNNDANVQQ